MAKRYLVDAGWVSCCDLPLSCPGFTQILRIDDNPFNKLIKINGRLFFRRTRLDSVKIIAPQPVMGRIASGAESSFASSDIRIFLS